MAALQPGKHVGSTVRSSNSRTVVRTPDSSAFAQRQPVDQVDRWWNVAVDDQATDRAFRIGLRRASQVRRFFCTGTIEEMIGPRVVTRPALSAAASGG